jgi:hypothetical protein
MLGWFYTGEIMSKKNLMTTIKRLRLKAGDILVVRDLRTAVALMDVGKHIPLRLDIPIVIAPDGIEKITLKQLKDVVIRVVAQELEGKI